MRIVFISDTHGKHGYYSEELKNIKADVIVHAGDFSSRGYEWELKDFLDWYNTLPFTTKIYISGNHDWVHETSPVKAKELLEKYPGITYLQDSEITIEGIKFYGSPWQPRFFNWAFNKDRGEDIRKYWLKIPLDTKVLITHGPVQGILDYVEFDGKNVGCADLLDIVNSLVLPQIHVCGHIHSAYGTQQEKDTLFINASLLNERYNPKNKPIVVEILNGKINLIQ